MKSINRIEVSNYIYILMMILIFLVSSNVWGQSFLKDEISVVEFNTSWNEDNFIKNVDKLKNCTYHIIVLCDNLDYMDRFDIKQPTIIIYNNGEEIVRFKSGIMLDFSVGYKELQKEVDGLLLNKFN